MVIQRSERMEWRSNWVKLSSCRNLQILKDVAGVSGKLEWATLWWRMPFLGPYSLFFLKWWILERDTVGEWNSHLHKVRAAGGTVVLVVLHRHRFARGSCECLGQVKRWECRLGREIQNSLASQGGHHSLGREIQLEYSFSQIVSLNTCNVHLIVECYLPLIPFVYLDQVVSISEVQRNEYFSDL